MLTIAVVFGLSGQASAATGAITLTTPVSSNTYVNNMPLIYSLTDTPGAGTVRLILAGSTTYTITLTDTTSGGHSTTINLSNVIASATVASISPAVNAIPDGLYSVSMSYQNAAFEPPATSVTRTNVRIDQAAPILQSLSPANNATNVSATPNLQLNFNESTQKGTGNILIKKVSDDSTVETIAVSSGQVTGQNTTTITITPSVTLTNDTAYYVVIPSTAFRDAFTHSFAGFSTSSSWQFTVVAASSSPSTSENATDQASIPVATIGAPVTGFGTPPNNLPRNILAILATALTGAGLFILRRSKSHLT